jgi:hypothetical protein
MMMKRFKIALGMGLTAALGIAPACGSDTKSGVVPVGSGGAGGNGGSGGSAVPTGGSAPGGSPSALPCQSACDTAGLTALMMPLCCIDANTCGVDGSEFMAGCLNPADFLGDGGFTIPEPEPLDDECDNVTITTQALGEFSFALAGCCTASGECGGAFGMPGETDVECLTHEEIAAQSSPSFTFTVSDDPGQTCTQDAPVDAGPDPVDAGPDASPDPVDAGPEPMDAGPEPVDAGTD